MKIAVDRKNPAQLEISEESFASDIVIHVKIRSANDISSAGANVYVRPYSV